MHRHSWSTNKGYMQNTTLLCPLVQRCGCPREAKLEKTLGQFILYIPNHAGHTVADHKDDRSRYLSVDKQDLFRKAIKTAPMNTAAELIKNAQDSPIKQVDAKLKCSVTSHICSERAKLLKVECDCGELTSDICSLKRLADKKILKSTVQQHIACVESSALTDSRHSA